MDIISADFDFVCCFFLDAADVSNWDTNEVADVLPDPVTGIWVGSEFTDGSCL